MLAALMAAKPVASGGAGAVTALVLGSSARWGRGVKIALASPPADAIRSLPTACAQLCLDSIGSIQTCGALWWLPTTPRTIRLNIMIDRQTLQLNLIYTTADSRVREAHGSRVAR